MQKISRRKDFLKTVLGKLKTEKDGYCRVKHKRGWLGFLRDGDPVVTPQKLHRVLNDVVETEGMRPRGEKLFCLRCRYCFTARGDGTPFRPEEALERFIMASNKDTSDKVKFFNQIPIGGGKESIDIGIQEDDSKFTFVELKPWVCHDSPLYALIEVLKNLVEYRTILKEKNKNIPRYTWPNLMILAPREYFQAYQLLDDSGTRRQAEIVYVEKVIRDFSEEFKTGISLRYLELDKQAFLEKCKKAFKNQGAVGQQIISIEGEDPIPELMFNRWKILASAA